MCASVNLFNPGRKHHAFRRLNLPDFAALAKLDEDGIPVRVLAPNRLESPLAGPAKLGRLALEIHERAFIALRNGPVVFLKCRSLIGAAALQDARQDGRIARHDRNGFLLAHALVLHEPSDGGVFLRRLLFFRCRLVAPVRVGNPAQKRRLPDIGH